MAKRVVQFLIWTVQKAITLTRLNPFNVSIKIAEVIDQLRATLDEIEVSLEDNKLSKEEIASLIGQFGKLLMALF